jgi:hypothetical protein
MPSTLEKELIDIYEREIETLSMTKSKYSAVIGQSDIASIAHTFSVAIEHGTSKVTAQMLYDMIHDESGAALVEDN